MTTFGHYVIRPETAIGRNFLNAAMATCYHDMKRSFP